MEDVSGCTPRCSCFNVWVFKLQASSFSSLPYSSKYTECNKTSKTRRGPDLLWTTPSTDLDAQAGNINGNYDLGEDDGDETVIKFRMGRPRGSDSNVNTTYMLWIPDRPLSTTRYP